jgi:integrase
MVKMKRIALSIASGSGALFVVEDATVKPQHG